MSKVKQALESAIEEIKWADNLHDWHDGLYEALETCKSALSELEKCEPVGFIDEADEGIFGDVQNGIAEGLCKVGDLLYTTPQIQQPLKRLDADKIGFIFRKEMTLFEFYNALMDATEELNHD